MSISSYVKANRKLISGLLAVIVVEVSFLIFWGAVAYKNERLDAEAQRKEFVDLMNQKEQEEQEKWEEIQQRLREWDGIIKRVQKTIEQAEKLREEALETRFRLVKLRFQLDLDHGFPSLHERKPRSWDIYPPGHPYGPTVETDMIIKSPKPLSGKPFLGMEGDHLKSIEENAITDQHSRDD